MLQVSFQTSNRAENSRLSACSSPPPAKASHFSGLVSLLRGHWSTQWTGVCKGGEARGWMKGFSGTQNHHSSCFTEWCQGVTQPEATHEFSYCNPSLYRWGHTEGRREARKNLNHLVLAPKSLLRPLCKLLSESSTILVGQTSSA